MAQLRTTGVEKFKLGPGISLVRSIKQLHGSYGLCSLWMVLQEMGKSRDFLALLGRKKICTFLKEKS